MRFLSQGSYQLGVGNDFMSVAAQRTVSVIIDEVVHVMNQHLCPLLVRFPTEDEEIEAIVQR